MTVNDLQILIGSVTVYQTLGDNKREKTLSHTNQTNHQVRYARFVNVLWHVDYRFIKVTPDIFQTEQFFDLGEGDNDTGGAGEATNHRVRDVIDEKAKFEHGHNEQYLISGLHFYGQTLLVYYETEVRPNLFWKVQIYFHRPWENIEQKFPCYFCSPFPIPDISDNKTAQRGSVGFSGSLNHSIAPY